MEGGEREERGGARKQRTWKETGAYAYSTTASNNICRQKVLRPPCQALLTVSADENQSGDKARM